MRIDLRIVRDENCVLPVPAQDVSVLTYFILTYLVSMYLTLLILDNYILISIL